MGVAEDSRRRIANPDAADERSAHPLQPTQRSEMVTAKPRHRLQFEFSADTYERLAHMKGKAGAASFAELVRDALRVYEWLLDQEKEGYDLALVKDGKLVKGVKFLL